MKKQLMILLVCSAPVAMAADTVATRFTRLDGATIAALTLGCIALLLTRRMQKP